jgi:S-adenosylmethionine hydrolase
MVAQAQVYEYGGAMRPVALLTDFGLGDHYVGVLHAVLERDAPGVTRIDLGHEIAPGDVWQASFVVRCAWPHLPARTVVLAIVDPGVGTERRAVAVRVGDRVLVAPDNGLADAVGPPDAAVSIEWRRMGVSEPSRTFHGRDLFAPAAARVARGDALEDLGGLTSHGGLVPCPLPSPARRGDGWLMTILHVDRFGNLVTNLTEEGFAATSMSFAPDRVARRVATFGDGADDEVVLLVGSCGLLELVVNGGSAAAATGLGRGDVIEVGE